MDISVVGDQPATEDFLGFDKYANVLTSIIADHEALPLTVGIFGAWGTGKTTLLRMIGERLGSRKTECVWFNAWKYNSSDLIGRALLTVIHNRIWDSGRINASAWQDIITRVGDCVGQITAGRKWGSLLFESVSLDPAYKNLIEEATRDLITQYVGDKGRLVILIDDLDRCLPESAIAVLETLKLYLDLTRTVVVLAMDRAAIEQAIAQRYPNQESSGRNYIDKLINVPFNLPPAQEDGLSNYIQALKLPYVGPKNGSTIKRILLAGSDRNMRTLKRLVNGFGLALHFGTGLGMQEAEWPVLAKLLVVQTRFPSLFALLHRSPDAISSIHRLLASEDDAKAALVSRNPWLAEHAAKAALCGFLEQTNDVPCSKPEQIERLLGLTRLTG